MSATSARDRTLSRARILVTVPIVFVGFVPMLADFNPSHAINPGWPGHARLHLVWLVATNTLVSTFGLWTLWRPATT